jgi:hypothetical protein
VTAAPAGPFACAIEQIPRRILEVLEGVLGLFLGLLEPALGLAGSCHP